MGTAPNMAVTAAELASVTTGVNDLFVFLAGVLVFFMHTGFAMVEAAGVQPKNRQHILLKNVTLVAVSALAWWLLGYLVSGGGDGTDPNSFIGTQDDAQYTVAALAYLPKTGTSLIGWFFGFAFAATSATIVSGCIAERASLKVYLIFAMFLTAFIYPVVAAWCWRDAGWLKKAAHDEDTSKGFVDFAGSGVVHMVGGCAGLVFSTMMGPRKFLDDGQGGFRPRFNEDGTVNSPAMSSSSMPFAALGTLILWVGWFGFNPGTQVAIVGADGGVVGLCLVNTVLCPAASAFTCFLLSFVATPDLTSVLNSVLGGLVAITACCHCVQPWAAVLIGIFSCPCYIGSSMLLKKLKIDDVIDASPVHFFCGIWGLIATGLFMDERLAGTGGHKYGCFMGDDGTLLGWQLCGIIVITLWTAVLTAVFLLPLHFLGMLRLSEEEEQLGLDGMMLKYSGQSVTGTPPSPASTKRTAEVSLDLEAPAATGVGVVHTGATPEQQPDVKRTCM